MYASSTYTKKGKQYTTIFLYKKIIFSVFQEVEMTGSFLVSSMERLNLVSFGETIGYSQIGLLIEKPKAETRDDSLLAPFSSQVSWCEVPFFLLISDQHNAIFGELSVRFCGNCAKL